MNTPAGFARLDDQDDYDYRSVSADGVVVAVRALHNRPQAGLAFWSRAVDERLRSQGYTPVGAPTDVQSADGVAGRQFAYGRVIDGRAHGYSVTVFVTDGGFLRAARVYVLEAGGDREVFDRATAAVQAVVRTFRT